jgi:hypothetical protein
MPPNARLLCASVAARINPEDGARGSEIATKGVRVRDRRRYGRGRDHLSWLRSSAPRWRPAPYVDERKSHWELTRRACARIMGFGDGKYEKATGPEHHFAKDHPCTERSRIGCHEDFNGRHALARTRDGCDRIIGQQQRRTQT